MNVGVCMPVCHFIFVEMKYVFFMLPCCLQQVSQTHLVMEPRDLPLHYGPSIHSTCSSWFKTVPHAMPVQFWVPQVACVLDQPEQAPCVAPSQTSQSRHWIQHPEWAHAERGNGVLDWPHIGPEWRGGGG